MPKKTYYYFLVFLVTCIISCSKNTKSQSKEDLSLKITNLLLKAKDAKGDQSLSILSIADSLYRMDSSIPDSLRLAILFRKGMAYRELKKIDTAALLFHELIDKTKKKDITSTIIKYYRYAWETDLDNRDPSSAISVANTLIKKAKKDGNHKAMFFAYNALSRTYGGRGLTDTKKNVLYSKLAIEAAKAANDTTNIIVQSNSLSISLAERGEIKEAFSLLNPYIENHKAYPIELNAELFLHYGVIEFYNNRFAESISNYKKSIEYSKKLNSYPARNHNLAIAYVNIGESYRELKKKKLELTHIDSALTYARKSKRIKTIKYVSKQHIISKFGATPMVYELMSDFDKLVVTQDQDYQNKIDKEQKDLKIASEKEIQLIKDKGRAELSSIQFRNRLIGLAVLSSLLGLIGYIFYQRRVFKFTRQKLQIQQRLLRSQMNPHFTFNILTTIQNQILSNPDNAENYLVKFSRLLRFILENSTKDYILLEKEIESLTKYITLQQLRFPEKFEYTIHYNNLEEDDFIFIPPMLLQPFIENCIEHGFQSIDYKGVIIITLSRKQKFIHCQIEDNGQGLKEATLPSKKSLSTQLIREYLKKVTKKDIHVVNKRESNNQESGILTTFLIPYKTTDI